MADPKLKRTKVEIAYTSDDGYRASLVAKAGQGSKNLKTGEEVPPQFALLDGIEELARLCELFGFGAEASQRIADAQSRVRQWQAERSAKAA